jgi:hypothetical protein
MPALQGKGPVTVRTPLFVNQFNANPRFGKHRFMHGVHGSFGLGMFDGAGQFARSASEAFFYAANDLFHGHEFVSGIMTLGIPRTSMPSRAPDGSSG